MNHHGIIFTGANYLDHGRKGGGAKRIANHMKPYGWDIEVVEYYSFWSDEQIKEFLEKTVIPGTTKFIGFSYTWLSNDWRIEQKIKYIKSLYPDLLYLVGGQTPFETDLGVDYYIFGYGEEAIKHVLQYEFQGGPPVIHKIHFGGRYVDGIHTYTSHNLREYGISWDEHDHLTSKDVLTIELSRGCKFACKFCNFPYIGMRDDTSRTEESIYRELNENYEKWGITNYLVADDTFNDRNEKMIKLRDAVKRLDFKPNFSGYIRLDLLKAHPEHLEILGETNFWGQFYGIETFNHESGKIIGKGQDPEITKQLLLNTREYFNKHVGRFRATASMIAGLPKEPLSKIEESHKWYLENWTDQTVVWHPLQIVETAGTMQAFGKDLARFGYERIDPPKDDLILKDWLSKSLSVKLKEETVFWKNEHTNSYEVTDLCYQYRQDEFAISNWALLSYFSNWNEDEAMKLKMPPYEVYAYEPYQKASKAMIDSYIQKKLKE